MNIIKDDWSAVSKKSRDVQYEKPRLQLSIDRVGFQGVTVALNRFSRPPIVYSSGHISLMVDIPPNQRGINMSRTMIGLTDSINEGANELEELAPKMAGKLLNMHEYSSKSIVRMRADGFLESKSPITEHGSHEHFRVKVGAIMTRARLSRFLGVTATGISTCPCGAELMRSRLDHDAVESDVMPTHMQRARATLLVKLDSEDRLAIADLLSVVLKSMSGGTYSVLKRADEGFVIYSALKNPKFVEDIHRAIASRFIARYPNLDGNPMVYISVISEESIHNFNASASGWHRYSELGKRTH